MMVTTRGSVIRMVAWQWRYALVMLCAGLLAYAIDAGLALKQNLLPTLPLAVVGGALGIFVSFRTNSAYDRWWEGRKLWGGMVNVSRHLASQVLTYLSREGEQGVVAERVVRRHIAYVHMLRCLLRGHDIQQDEYVRQFINDEELRALERETNPTHALIHTSFDELRQLVDRHGLSEFRLASVDLTFQEILNHQGGMERILKTPMPLVYGFLAHQLVIAFSCLFPFAVVNDLGLFTIPLNLLVGLAFALISEAGRVLENPFTMFYNGLPLSALCATIEQNLRNRLGEFNLPPQPAPNEAGVLM